MDRVTRKVWRFIPCSVALGLKNAKCFVKLAFQHANRKETLQSQLVEQKTKQCTLQISIVFHKPPFKFYTLQAIFQSQRHPKKWRLRNTAIFDKKRGGYNTSKSLCGLLQHLIFLVENLWSSLQRNFPATLMCKLAWQITQYDKERESPLIQFNSRVYYSIFKSMHQFTSTILLRLTLSAVFIEGKPLIENPSSTPPCPIQSKHKKE